MTQPDLDHCLQEFPFQVLNRSVNVICLEGLKDLEATKEVLNHTFNDMERLYALKCNCSPSALDTSTWLLLGAINLAHRVVRLEREVGLQTRDTISKLLDSIPDDVYTNVPATDADRSLPME
jgi:hypothetical protein